MYDAKSLEQLLKALANRRRLAILRYLKETREASVGDIASAINLSFRATSKHLKILFMVDILDKEQRSVEMFYSYHPKQKPIMAKLLYFI